MASTLNADPARLAPAIARFIEANRTLFDTPAALPGATGDRVRALEARLAAAQAELARAHHRLHAFETSRMWRMTRPVRWAIEALRLERPLPPPPEPPSPLPTPLPGTQAVAYANWIRTEEAGSLAALLRAGPGHQATRPQRIGLVQLAQAHAARPADLGVACPEGCAVLVLERDDRPSTLVARALDQMDVDLVCFIDAEDRLASAALSLVAQVLSQYPQTDLLFADEDWLDADGARVRPFFKPGWDSELQRGRDLVGPFAFFRTALLRQASVSDSPAWRYDLANQVAAATSPERIRHVPAMLCHRVVPPPDAGARQAAVASQLQRRGVAARLLPLANHPQYHRVSYALPSPPPMVSLIVPTRDHADLLRVCADGVLNRTTYQRLEMLIVDNGTAEPDALALLDQLAADARVKVLRMPGPFNWSALNNAAAAQAAGEVLVLLNNDIAVTDPDWLAILVAYALQPGVGAVGAKLLYPDGRVQHAGLTTDAAGLPRHIFRYAPGDADGVFDLMALGREVWAVTGACMATRRDIFLAVGGLNEALPVAYNDVDFCLRLTANGYRLVWTPWSVLEHRELASRPPDHSPARQAQAREERDRLLRDWGSLVLLDPFLNPNLHLLDEQPSLSSTGHLRSP